MPTRRVRRRPTAPTCPAAALEEVRERCEFDQRGRAHVVAHHLKCRCDVIFDAIDDRPRHRDALARRMPAWAATLLGLATLTGCTEAAKTDLEQAAAAVQDRDLAQAGQELEQAAEKTNAVVEAKIDVIAEGTVDAAAAAREIAAPQGAAEVTCDGTVCTMPREEFDALLGNPLLVAAQVTVTPEHRAGVTHWRIESVREGSTAHALGLRPADVVLRMNGKPIGNPPDSALLDAVRSDDRVVLELERDGKTVRRELRCPATG